MTMNAMRPARNYDLTEITRLLLKMRDNDDAPEEELVSDYLVGIREEVFGR